MMEDAHEEMKQVNKRTLALKYEANHVIETRDKKYKEIFTKQ